MTPPASRGGDADAVEGAGPPAGSLRPAVPPELVTAVHAAHTDPELPPQGYPALRDHLLHGAPAPEDLEDWLRNQTRAVDMADELLERIAATAPPDGLPAEFATWWYRTLRYPWAEELSIAVVNGYLDTGA